MDHKFDIFLSHNSNDKSAIKKLKELLIDKGISAWLDEDELQPGLNWVPLLEKAIKNCGSAGAFVGSNGVGPWANEEILALLRRAVKENIPVIPVLLPGNYKQPDLPLFLASRTYIDMRSGFSPKLIDALVWGITSEKPVGQRQKQSNGNKPPTSLKFESNKHMKWTRVFWILLPLFFATIGLIYWKVAYRDSDCEISGKSFEGIYPHLDNGKGKMKVLMIHGMGDHQPGYSSQFLEKLAKELDLPVIGGQQKDIPLTTLLDSTKNLGNLRVNRLLSKDRRKELLFYELTWSMITAKQKEVLAYDNFGQSPDRRADVNNMLKAFSKNTFSDIIIYLGESRVYILMSFAQSFCWMTKNWEDLPDNERQTCKGIDTTNENIKVDQYAFVTHSLGSRITIDGLMRIIAVLSYDGRDVESSHSFKDHLFKDKVFSIFILSNQLPMLQLGRELPEVSNQNSAYCQPESVKYSERAVSRMPIFTFSNPNDILSYPISPEFVEKYLDSRLCPEVVNININMASLYNTFGLGNIVNPLDANTGYYEDDRVVALIAKGFGNANTSKVVQQHCHFSVEEK